MSERQQIGAESGAYIEPEDSSGLTTIHEYHNHGDSIILDTTELRNLRDVLNNRFSDEDNDTSTDDEDHRPVQNFRDVERRLMVLEDQQ